MFVSESRGDPIVHSGPLQRSGRYGEVTNTRYLGDRFSLSQEHQGGWRGPKDRDIEPDVFAASGREWAASNSMILNYARIELMTTPSPLVRTPSLPVHYRWQRKRKIPFLYRDYGTYQNHNGYWSDMAMVVGNRFATPALPGPILSELSPADRLALQREAADRMRAVRPTKPAVGLGQTIAELRDFPRLAKQLADLTVAIARQGKAKAGDTYLGYQFGLAPLISDIQRCAEIVAGGSKIFNQFIRDSGALVKRDVVLPMTTSSTTFSVSQPSLFAEVTYVSSRVYGKLTASHGTSDIRTEVRAFGLYEYFVGDPGDALSKSKEYELKAQKLLGLKITPSVVYELTPWSWLVDWFVDIGGLLAFQQDVSDYSLALRRAGLTIRHSQRKNVYFPAQVYLGSGQHADLSPVTWPLQEEYAYRFKGESPYGIDVSWDELSPFQLSILAALGLSSKNW